MGMTTSMAFAEAAATGSITLEAALTAHLQSNIYPPIDLVFVPVAVDALRHVEEGDWGAIIPMPNDRILTAEAVVSQLHLEPFTAFLDTDD